MPCYIAEENCKAIDLKNIRLGIVVYKKSISV